MFGSIHSDSVVQLPLGLETTKIGGIMVAQNLLKELLALPAAARLDLVHRLWDSLRDDSVSLPFSDEQKQELDLRYAEFLQDPTEGSTWDEVEAFACARLRA